MYMAMVVLMCTIPPILWKRFSFIPPPHFHSTNTFISLSIWLTQWGYDADHDGDVSAEEEACGKIVDENGNGEIDENEKKAFIACLKGAKGDYDGNADDNITPEEVYKTCLLEVCCHNSWHV